ncbi:MAG: HlyC/CorC family transporter [Deltaproteobacteria bacterium]|nr:HlyC/CorC family transporter [Deltaproteobacteria bacterium]
MDRPSTPATFESLRKRLLNIIGLAKSPDTTKDLEQEIQELLEDGEEHGLISTQEGMMINSIFELRDTMAREIMTPRTEMVCAPLTASAAELIALITENGFTRIPIFTDSLDNIVGILHAKDLLGCSTMNEPQPKVADIIKPPLRIMETYKISQLLRDFKDKKNHLAIVTDEFGATRGLVTLEDVLEEIVGEINDESDKDDMGWRIIDSRTVLTDAKVDVEEVESFFDVTLPKGPYESIGGLVIHQLGRLPGRGEYIEVSNLLLQVMSADKRRIATLKITNQGQKKGKDV